MREPSRTLRANAWTSASADSRLEAPLLESNPPSGGSTMTFTTGVAQTNEAQKANDNFANNMLPAQESRRFPKSHEPAPNERQPGASTRRDEQGHVHTPERPRQTALGSNNEPNDAQERTTATPRGNDGHAGANDTPIGITRPES